LVLDVESEQNHVAVANFVFFSFQTQFACFTCLRERSGCDEIVVKLNRNYKAVAHHFFAASFAASFAFFAASLAFAALMSVGGQAFAITGDWIPDNDHPFVGLIAFYGSDGEFIWRCSGALISPTVFLTAGHCADTVGGATTARIWFQQNAGANYNPATQHDPVTGYPDDCAAGTLGVLCAEVSAGHIYNFGFTGELTVPNTHDVGIVVLDQTPSAVTEYGQLPQAGQLDALATARGRQSVLFTESGYGLTYKPKDKSGKPATSYRVRLMAESHST